MASLCSIILLSCIFLIGGASACSLAYNFDYILLAIQWPATFCATQSCIKHSDVWQIHGAWPQYNSGKWPQDCCFENKFNATVMESIKSDLMHYWPSLKASGGSESFWEHEWLKHGTCAKDSDRLKGQLNYFKTTMEVFKALPLSKSLTDANILPSNSHVHTVKEFHDALQKGMGHRVELACNAAKHGQHMPVLAHLYVCLDKHTLNQIDCPSHDDKCGNGFISYPQANHFY